MTKQKQKEQETKKQQFGITAVGQWLRLTILHIMYKLSFSDDECRLEKRFYIKVLVFPFYIIYAIAYFLVTFLSRMDILECNSINVKRQHLTLREKLYLKWRLSK